MAGYISQFQALAAQTEWNDAALLAFFKWGLSPEVRELMSSDGISSSNLAEAQLQATLAYQKLLIQRQALLSNNISLRSNEHTSSIVHNPPPACVFPAVPVSHVFKDQNRSPQPHKLAPEEGQRRKDKNLCLYCGDDGHFVLACPCKTQLPSNAVDSPVGPVKKRHWVDSGDIVEPFAKSTCFL